MSTTYACGVPTVSKLSLATKRLLLGRPFRSDTIGNALIPKRVALPVFASDALSSVAYAPEEIFLVLSLGGMAAVSFTPLVGLAVCVVMVVVIASYRQNVYAYPSGGGDYEVARVNIGPNAGLTVGAALLIDYVLTVAVSISSAAANIGSAIPFVGEHKAIFAVLAIGLLAAVNLRGIRESGFTFAIPTYAFMAAMAALIGWGLFQILVLDKNLEAESAQFELRADNSQVVGLALVFLVAKAFSSGCAALTGVEAISNGVPAFHPPKSRNAATTLLMLGGIAIAFFVGLIALAKLMGVQIAEHPASQLIGAPEEYRQKTMLAQLAEPVFATIPFGFYVVLVVTALILVLAANTAFNGFPILGSVLARDRYLPRQLATRGDRLAFSNGIVALAVAASLFVVVFGAEVSQLIQLYIVGVFVAFTISQFGMVRHWNRLLRNETVPAIRRRMLRSRVINFVGLLLTGTVLVIVLITKFTAGAWIAIFVMSALYALMRLIHRHYFRVAQELEQSSYSGVLPSRTHAVVLVSTMHLPTLRALTYARAFRPDSLEALTVNIDDSETRRLAQQWRERDFGVPLKVVESPYREVTTPIIEYIRRRRSRNPRDVIAVFIPEYVVGSWWEELLHNQSAMRLKSRLRLERGVVVTSVPWQLVSSSAAEGRDDDTPAPSLRWGGVERQGGSW